MPNYRGHQFSGQQASGSSRTSSYTTAVPGGVFVVADSVGSPTEFRLAGATSEFSDGRLVGISCLTPLSERNSVITAGGCFMSVTGTPSVGDAVYAGTDGIPQPDDSGGAVAITGATFRSAPTSEGTALIVLS